MSATRPVVKYIRVEVCYTEDGEWFVVDKEFPIYAGENWFLNERMGALLAKAEERGEIFEMRTAEVYHDPSLDKAEQSTVRGERHMKRYAVAAVFDTGPVTIHMAVIEAESFEEAVRVAAGHNKLRIDEIESNSGEGTRAFVDGISDVYAVVDIDNAPKTVGLGVE